MTPGAAERPRVIYFTRFKVDPDGGGGSRRAAQVASLLGEMGTVIFSSARLDGVPPKIAEKLKLALKRPCGKWVSFTGLRGWQAAIRQYARRQDRVSRAWAGCLGHGPVPDFVLLDDPLYFPALVRRAERLHLPAAAVCHNLEGSLPGQTTPAGRSRMSRREFDLYRRCRLAVTLSIEDTADLEREGVRAVFWPYFPSPAVTTRLGTVRRNRAGAVLQDYLLLGSCLNAATRRGMLEAARWWADGPTREAGERLLVAGFGSDRLLPELSGLQGVERLGPLSDAELDARLTTVRGALCHQAEGGGALTRITEFLLAGVPVIASRHAARSFHGTPGVLEYAALEDLPERLRSLKANPPNVPAPSPPDPTPLRDALEALQSGPGI